MTSWRQRLRGTASRWLLALFFTVAGILHFVFPDAYRSVMPAWLGWPAALVAISGVAESAGGLGLLWQPLRRSAGIGLLLLCVAVLPANVQMLLDALDAQRAGWIIFLLVLRLPLQLVLMAWIWMVAWPARDPARQSAQP
jgi:uncharacterized membrane protein